MKPKIATPRTAATVWKNAAFVRDLCCKLEAELIEALKDARRWQAYCRMSRSKPGYIERLTMRIDAANKEPDRGDR